MYIMNIRTYVFLYYFIYKCISILYVTYLCVLLLPYYHSVSLTTCKYNNNIIILVKCRVIIIIFICENYNDKIVTCHVYIVIMFEKITSS